MPPVAHVPVAAAAAHAALVVALDAGDLAGADFAAAERLRATCPGCASLAADLAAIRGALVALPAPARRRDHRLTPEDAAGLRPAGWRRVLDWLAAPRSAVRPLATGLATLGIVGLLVSAGLPGLGSAGSAPVLSSVGSQVEYGPPDDSSGSGAGGAVPAPSPTAAPAAGEASGASPRPLANATPAGPPLAAGPSAAPTQAGAAAAGEASPTPPGERSSVAGAADDTTDAGAAKSEGSPGPGMAPVAIASAGLLAAGVLLLLARAVALRRAR
ncbi:MAG: hypothetical protein M0T75_01285 [Chloroflexi bacterium]|nr:hypothetical protein [Chloroflexota bacterium]